MICLKQRIFLCNKIYFSLFIHFVPATGHTTLFWVLGIEETKRNGVYIPVRGNSRLMNNKILVASNTMKTIY